MHSEWNFYWRGKVIECGDNMDWFCTTVGSPILCYTCCVSECCNKIKKSHCNKKQQPEANGAPAAAGMSRDDDDGAGATRDGRDDSDEEVSEEGESLARV